MKTRVMVFGTFDFLHAGHEALFRQARALAEDVHLIVSVARDRNALRVKSSAPREREEDRLAAVARSPLVDEAVLGDVAGCMEHIIRAHPAIIALGYDQEGEYVDALARALAAGDISARVVRLEAFRPDVYKSSLIRTGV